MIARILVKAVEKPNPYPIPENAPAAFLMALRGILLAI
jgi:hypothetical protein